MPIMRCISKRRWSQCVWRTVVTSLPVSCGNFGDELLTNDSLDLVIPNIFEEIVVHDSLEFVESVLQVCDVDMNDTGVYSCAANNFRGCDSSNFTLSVVQAGEILRNCVFNTAQTSSTDSNLMFVTN